MKVYRCKGCGEYYTIVEVSLVPRTVGVRPPTEPIYGPEYDTGHDVAYWEDEVVVGYGCLTESCRWWQGNLGVGGGLDNGNIHAKTGPRWPSVFATIEEVE